MPVRSLLLGTVILGLLVATPAQAADVVRKTCASTTADGVRMKVQIRASSRKSKLPFTCVTAQGVVRKYGSMHPSQENNVTAEFKFKGKTWSCYFVRDSSGYNCTPQSRNDDYAYISARF